VSLATATVALYGAGVAASISPCNVPLLPGYVVLAADASTVAGGRRWQRIAAFAGGVVATFVGLGLAAQAVGGWLSVGTVTLQRAAGAALVGFGVLLWLGHSGRLRRTTRLPIGERPGSWRALALGVGCAAAWTPCVGPLLGAALTGSGSALRAVVLLVAFASGTLTPFAVIAAAPGRLALARRAGRVASLAAATTMVVLGVALASGVYERLVAHLSPS
jgi:cytochrome c-type biogenesis protein